MNKSIMTVALTLIIFTTGNFAKADELTAEKYNAINTLFEVSNTDQLGTTMMNQFIPLILNIYKDKLSKEGISIIKDEMKNFFHDELIVKKSLSLRLQPVYHQNFTLDEIKQLIIFYRSPAGKKAMSPEFLQQTMRVGSTWGKSLAQPMMQRISQRLKKEGINLSK